MVEPAGDRLRIGASSWSAPSWEGVFYPPGMPSSGYLGHYSERFDTVEVDSTFYRIPDERMVDAWRERTPPGFTFAAKFPQVITHDRLLEGCAEERDAFLRSILRLGDKLGPLLLQFRYFRRDEFPDPNPFIDRLERFLPSLPRGRPYAVEVRNKRFVTARLLEVLHRHRAALAFIDHPWFFDATRFIRRPSLLTADFAYVRWLGDRRAIEEKTTRWDRLIVDRAGDLGRWVPVVRGLVDRGVTVYGYFNNHYAGYAIGSIEQFRTMWAASRPTADRPD